MCNASHFTIDTIFYNRSPPRYVFSYKIEFWTLIAKDIALPTRVPFVSPDLLCKKQYVRISIYNPRWLSVGLSLLIEKKFVP